MRIRRFGIFGDQSVFNDKKLINSITNEEKEALVHDLEYKIMDISTWIGEYGSTPEGDKINKKRMKAVRALLIDF